jgi:low affinity Fe/Cu permease
VSLPVESNVNGEPPAAVNGASRQSIVSRVLHRLGELSATSAATMVAALVSLAFLIAALSASRATPWLTAFEAFAAAITLVMVFALQHSQFRQQAALQRKLDEILRVLPGADPRLVHLETGSSNEFDAVEERHVQVRDEARSLPPAET